LSLEIIVKMFLSGTKRQTIPVPSFLLCNITWPSTITQQTFYIGPTSARYWILYRPDIGYPYRPDVGCATRLHIGPILATDISCRYCADIHRSSLFLAKTPFSWWLNPNANKIDIGKTEECINFNKFIYTNFKATF